MRRLLPILAVLLFLSGCASPTAAPAAVVTPTVTPTPEYATENQVASVVAKYQADWTEVTDGATECRLEWVLNPGSLRGFSCYLREQTLSTTSEIVLRDLAELEVPPSMTELVTDLTATLDGIVRQELKVNCGEDEEPADTQPCTEALGNLNFHYNALEGHIAAWSPYL